MKRLKKQLRSTKRRMTLAMILLLTGSTFYDVESASLEQPFAMAASISKVGTLAGLSAWTEKDLPTQGEAGTDSVSAEAVRTIAQSGASRKAYLRKNYVCGEETQLLGTMQANRILQFAKLHPEYELFLDSEGSVIFLEQVEDLTPKCKENVFFGVDKAGNLNLYNGAPENDNVIRTFFQLNIEHLKSSLPEESWQQLTAGIRVTDLEEYNSVLSTFSDYALTENQAQKH
ncbi:MAG: BofC C-terminal domain-containing protein [Gorillibacterium sp.]|nr:BofC C-terminal domain-containing protein [Gorillibacterium sp.]